MLCGGSCVSVTNPFAHTRKLTSVVFALSASAWFSSPPAFSLSLASTSIGAASSVAAESVVLTGSAILASPSFALISSAAAGAAGASASAAAGTLTSEVLESAVAATSSSLLHLIESHLSVSFFASASVLSCEFFLTSPSSGIAAASLVVGRGRGGGGGGAEGGDRGKNVEIFCALDFVEWVQLTGRDQEGG